MATRRTVFTLVLAVALGALPLLPMPRADAAIPVYVAPTTTVDLDTPVHDLEIAGESVWVTLPDVNRIAELETGSLAEQRRVLVGSGPRGITELDDGSLAVALHGATGYVEVDPATEELHTVTLPLLGAPQTWDVAAIPGNRVLVSSNPSSGGFAYIVAVDRADDWSSTRVASQRIIRAGPVFAVGGPTILVGEGFSPNSLYRLDSGDPALPIVEEDNHGDLGGTQQLALTTDGSRVYLGSGQAVRTSDLIAIGSTAAGRPVLDETAGHVHSVTTSTIRTFETTTFSEQRRYDITGCGFSEPYGYSRPVNAAVLVDGGDAMLLAADDRVCRLQLDQATLATTTTTSSTTTSTTTTSTTTTTTSTTTTTAPPIDPEPAPEPPFIWLFDGEGLVHDPFRYGEVGDILLFCDWDADGIDEPVAVRPSNQYWYLGAGGGSSDVARAFRYGGDPRLGDVPICGDWDGDGGDDPGVYRLSTSEFHLRMSMASGRADRMFRYGNPSLGDRPIVGDFDGDGDTETSIFRMSDNHWYITYQARTGTADVVFRYGRPGLGDVALVGNWDGRGGDTPAIFRDGDFYLRNSLSGGNADFVVEGGLPEDVPGSGHWTPGSIDGLAVIGE